MKSFSIRPTSGVRGIVILPGDKSIAHRALILSAIARGSTRINNFPANLDCLCTLEALKKLGIRISKVRRFRGSFGIKVFGRGLSGLKKPLKPIFLGESGTSFRLLCGLLSGYDFRVRLEAGVFLSRRPMRRISLPLRMMGAKIIARRLLPEEYPPFTVKGGILKGITYKLPVASAQVKSAIILAGLHARGVTRVIEPIRTRDHTERMLKLFQANIKTKENIVTIKGLKELVSPGIIDIPGDISSAAFFIILTAILPGSGLLIKNVSLNPLRTGVLRVLKRMRADIKIIRSFSRRNAKVEPAGDIAVKSSLLKATLVKKEEIPSLIDELPVLMVAASLARGRTIFEGVGELRVKETDRINSMLKNLKRMGAQIKIVKKKGLEHIVIDGVKELRGSRVKSFGDHRSAMSMLVAGMAARGETRIADVACIRKSFPDFIDKLTSIIRS